MFGPKKPRNDCWLLKGIPYLFRCKKVIFQAAVNQRFLFTDRKINQTSNILLFTYQNFTFYRDVIDNIFGLI